MFDVEKMFDFCCKEIMLFANDHKDEILKILNMLNYFAKENL